MDLAELMRGDPTDAQMLFLTCRAGHDSPERDLCHWLILSAIGALHSVAVATGGRTPARAKVYMAELVEDARLWLTDIDRGPITFRTAAGLCFPNHEAEKIACLILREHG